MTLATLKPADTLHYLAGPRVAAPGCRRLIGRLSLAGSANEARPCPTPRPPTHAIAPLTIDVVSDVVCPWCFIGKRRLEKALALKPDIPVEVRFHPYFLNPVGAARGHEPATNT